MLFTCYCSPVVPALEHFQLLTCGTNQGQGLTTHRAPGNRKSWGPCVLTHTQKSI
ncbi:unnamed protein product [Staurois parvus]|uniref:Uncharacterized protein n=1 Tax=Staurois parvus TaxID=386267 RepID=A0ABN9D5C9_9NEOB|nr:unnamed protein product [Staurois parvus]